MAAKELNAIVSQRIEVTEGLIKLRIVPDGWELPEFEPGQYAALGLPGTMPRSPLADNEESPPKDPDRLIQRAYSIASSSVAMEYLEFYVGMVSTGSLSPRLFNLKVGNRLYVSEKCKGMFTLQQVPEQFNVVLIATGTGVAPYISMIRTEVASGINRNFAIFHGAYHSTDLGYHSELQTLDALSAKFSYLPTLTNAHEEIAKWKGHEGFVQKLWENRVLDEKWGFKLTHENTHVFLCGNPLMIDGMKNLLEGEGFTEHKKKNPDGNFHSEKYFVKL